MAEKKLLKVTPPEIATPELTPPEVKTPEITPPEVTTPKVRTLKAAKPKRRRTTTTTKPKRRRTTTTPMPPPPEDVYGSEAAYSDIEGKEYELGGSDNKAQQKLKVHSRGRKAKDGMTVVVKIL